jgi:hypothetical protein
MGTEVVIGLQIFDFVDTLVSVTVTIERLSSVSVLILNTVLVRVFVYSIGTDVVAVIVLITLFVRIEICETVKGTVNVTDVEALVIEVVVTVTSSTIVSAIVVG